MTPRLVFRPEARAEVREARGWYEAQSPGLGLEFARAVEAVLATISRTPAFYPVVEGAARRALLRRFPYQIIYEATAERSSWSRASIIDGTRGSGARAGDA